MKRIFTALLCAVFCLSTLAACGAATSGSPSSAASSAAMLEGSLEDIAGKLFEGIPEDDMPKMMTAPIESDVSENFLGAGVTADRYKEAVSCEPMISAIPLSVCLVRANSADDVAALQADIAANANPRKWVCVEADTVLVDSIGDVILLVMASEDIANTVQANFAALAQ